MESVRILIAMSNEASNSKLKAILAEYGYTVVDSAKDGHECLRKVRVLKPDVVVLDHGLPLMNGYEVSKVVIEDKISDAILFTAGVQDGLGGELIDESNFVSMTKPINKAALINTIELMMKSKRKIKRLEKEIEELRSTLDTRKEVEKAKGLLMKNLNLTEPEAFKRIQKQSMDRGIPMKEIAKAIILAYDI